MKKRTLFNLLTLLGLGGFLITACKGASTPIDELATYRGGDKNILKAAIANDTYSTSERYCYKVSNILTSVPNTFETWVRMPTTSIGGVIMGNVSVNNIGGFWDNSIDWMVDEDGHFKIIWGHYIVNYSFSHNSLFDNTWHHLALVRNATTQTFTLYIDGNSVGSYNHYSQDVLEHIGMVIGTDNRSWQSAQLPFHGDIKEVTLYKSSLSATEVAEDYTRGSGINESQINNCIGCWQLGEVWNKKEITDLSNEHNNAYLGNFCKFVDTVEIEEYDYSIIGLPDIQTNTSMPTQNWSNTNNWIKFMDWIKNHIESDKIKFAISVGDLVNNGNNPIQYSQAKEGFDLWEGKLPYSTCAGNHDYDGNCTDAGMVNPRSLLYYNAFFGVEQAKEFAEFGGTMYEGEMENSYYLLDVPGAKYCIINLEIFPRKSALRWAGRICEMFPDRRVIINTHVYNDYYNSIAGVNTCWEPATYGNFADSIDKTYGNEMWDILVSKHKNIFMTISGHFDSYDAQFRIDHGDFGNPIYNFLIDVQCTNVEPNQVMWSTNPLDLLAFFRFNEKTKKCYFDYFSPKYDNTWLAQNQFEFSFAEWQDGVDASYL